MKKFINYTLLAFILAGILFSLYWNFFVFLPKNLKIQALLKPGDVTIGQFIEQLDGALSFHPTLGNEDALNKIYPIAQKYITSGLSESSSQKLIVVLERHTNNWQGYKTRILLQLGKTYAIMYLKYQKNEYFSAAEKYYNLTLNQRRNEGDSLYGLYCIYQLHGDKVKAGRVKDHIESTWGALEGEINCQL